MWLMAVRTLGARASDSDALGQCAATLIDHNDDSAFPGVETPLTEREYMNAAHGYVT